MTYMSVSTANEHVMRSVIVQSADRWDRRSAYYSSFVCHYQVQHTVLQQVKHPARGEHTNIMLLFQWRRPFQPFASLVLVFVITPLILKNTARTLMVRCMLLSSLPVNQMRPSGWRVLKTSSKSSRWLRLWYDEGSSSRSYITHE